MALALAVGIGIASLFYLFIFIGGKTGFLNGTILYRYAVCHPVAIMSVFLFCIAMVSMTEKLWLAIRELRTVSLASKFLRDFVQKAPQDSPIESADWLEKMWRTLPTRSLRCWLGLRVAEIISRQTSRGTCRQLSDDLRDLAGRDADAQHDGYGLVRIISWAMPMFGFLGTVIGISETLGQMDTKALASGSQEAMNSLTAGLYVAFDTTAVGLILTVAAMFMMFVVGRLELRLLNIIDREVSDCLEGLLTEDDQQPKDIYRVEETIRLVSEQFVQSVERLVEKQSDHWRESIDVAQERWNASTLAVSDLSNQVITRSLNESLDRYVEKFEQAQASGAAQLDARYQQWQTTLSEQARSMHAHHAAVLRQTELLTELVEKGQHLQAIEDNMQQNLSRLTDVDRFHEVAICLTEAVAVLGTQLERAGHLKPKVTRRIPNESLPTSKASLVKFPDEADAASSDAAHPGMAEERRRRAA
jgi:biopolymer transport protein ExbB/TolQ